MNKNKIIIISMLLMGLALFVNMDEAAADASVIYVNATGGNDNWNGQSQFYVNGTTGPKKTINSGTTAVLANGTVNIADGTYSGTGNWGITLTKNMTIQGQSQNNTIIDGSGSRQIFVINSGVNVNLLNITIQNAQPSNTNGGAIRNNGGTLTVNNCKFSGNSATRTSWFSTTPIYGGAIYSTGNLNIINSIFLNNYAESTGWPSVSTYGGAIYSNGQLTISNTIFDGNYALNRGGAIFNDGLLSITGSSFNNNYVSGSGHDYNGGAIFNSNSGTLTLTGSTFNNNHASVGGALLTFNNSNITGCTFTGNNANTEYGGGAIAWGNTGTPATGTMNVKDSVFTNNRAGYGGAIWSYGTINVSGSTFTLNQANYNGGAIRTWGTLNIIGSDLSGNQAGTRGNAISNYQGTTTANFNRLIGSGSILECLSGSINALNNWWGSQTSPASKVNGNVTVSTWLVLNINAVPNPTHTGYTSTITADLTRDQNGAYYNPVNGHVPNGIPVQFTATLGSIPSTSTLVSGSTSRIFTAGNTPGVANVSATVDGVQVNTSINLNPVAALQISQKVNTPVNVGDRVNFQVSVVNNGPNTATNIQIRDIIPTGLSGVIVTYSLGTYNTNTGIWTIPSLTNGSTATLNITGNATAAMAGKKTENSATQINQTEYTPELAHSNIGVYTNLLNEAYVSSNGDDNTGDGTEARPFRTIATAIATVNPGGTIRIKSATYTEHDLTINKNLNIVGESANSTIIDAQKLGRIFNIASGSTVNITGLTLVNGSVTGNGGAINNAGNLIITGTNLLNNVATGTGGTIYNTGNAIVNFNRIIGVGRVIDSPRGSVNAINNWWGINADPISKVSGDVDVSTWLVLRVNVSKTSVLIGGTSNITADLTHNNLGVDTSNHGLLPSIFVSFNVINPISGSLNSDGDYTVNGLINSTFTGLTNGFANLTAGSDNENIDIQIVVGNVTLYVNNYPWANSYVYNYKQQVVWLVQVNNLGTTLATGIRVKVVVGSAFKVIGYNLIEPGVLEFDNATNTFTWIIGSLDGGKNLPRGSYASFSILLESLNPGSGDSSFGINSTIEGCNQINIGKTKTQTQYLTILPAADIQISQTVDNPNPVYGEYVEIVVRVKNNGPSTATNIIVNDLLPNGLVVDSDPYTSFIWSSGVYNRTSGNWTIDSLNNGEEVTLTIKARVTGANGQLISNRVYIVGTQTPYDWITANNSMETYLIVNEVRPT